MNLLCGHRKGKILLKTVELCTAVIPLVSMVPVSRKTAFDLNVLKMFES